MKATDPKIINEVVTKNFRDDLEGNLSDVITRLQYLYDEHSSKYEYLEIEISMDNDYGYEYTAVRLIGYRNETPAEVATRIAAEVKWKEVYKAKEIKEFERLQKKYAKSKV